MIEPSTIEKLKGNFRGELLQPGGASYEEARKVWNGMIDRRPALIARCAGVADVMQSVNFGRENSLLVAVRGGDHNLIDGKRRKRIARGSSTTAQEVNEVLKQSSEMRRMMKMYGNTMKGKMRGIGKLRSGLSG